MRIQNCDLSISSGWTYPFARSKPEDHWVEARDSGIIPDSLYHFYCLADYFSVEKVPPFLKDDRRILFSYLDSLATSILYAFQETDSLIKEMREYDAGRYSIRKAWGGESWDRYAMHKTVTTFKYLTVNLAGALDQFSETVALVLHGEIDELQIGRGTFTVLQRFSCRPLERHVGPVSPRTYYSEKLHEVLRAAVISEGSECSWLELFYLYRNKLAHLGNAMFPRVSLHDSSGEFYTFLPNRWPVIVQEHLSEGRTDVTDDPDKLFQFLEEQMVQQDLIEYSKGLVTKVRTTLNFGFKVMCDAYQGLRDCEPTVDIVDDLLSQRKQYGFRHFEGAE